ncbi:PREDICTED: transmembrane protein 242 isoform X2 [Dinoponera quadriceps]|uniref:Transmembrane protein 242 n=1 Tax=Dinoponera quadriceps TaxID=609295 RepID=A0A6P3XEP4_DINQU|nr:PREDICTED: transmembrane protein 242 isoform X2 [Dinoponera quadriceps]
MNLSALKMADAAVGYFPSNVMAESKDAAKTSITESAKYKERIYAVVFLSTVTGISALAGFSGAIATARKQDPKYFGKGISSVQGLHETGASLALRALTWGSFYAITGCGLLFYGIWKISGATNAEEFRFKMGSLLPKIPKNNPPQSRTEFEGLRDLLTYISEDWGQRKEE